jgi:tetratricopeptide (TPR) repeat protein
MLLAGSAWSTEAYQLGVTGDEYMKAEQYDKAADEFTEVLAQHDSYYTVLAYLHRGCCYYQLGKLGKATNDADEALAAMTGANGPMDTDLLAMGCLLKSSSLLAQGDYDKAKLALTDASLMPGVSAFFFPIYADWVDKVILAASGDKPIQLVALYKTLGKSTYELLTQLLSNKGWSQG